MELSQQVSVRHELHLTPELRQGISVLQMSAVDLTEYVRQSVEENPFLDDDDWEWPRHAQTTDEYSKIVSSDELALSSAVGKMDYGFQPSAEGGSLESSFIENETLADHLLSQLRLQVGDERLLGIGEVIVGCLDGEGYLRETLDDIAALCGASECEVGQIVALLQRMDPVGIASSCLAERLKKQLEAKGLLSEDAVVFLDKYLLDFGRKNPSQIARAMGVVPAVLDSVLEDIRGCDPHPAAQFGRSSDAIWPEVLVEGPDEEGSYAVSLQDFFLPHLKVNQQYKTLAKACDNGEAAAYLKEKLRQAESLIDNIEYRSTALFKVACCIVEYQQDFFREGASGMRPLTMGVVALATELSLSTVSRIANGNYMQTPRGVFELRYFFQAAASTSVSCDASRESVKHRLSELVAQEDPHRPLSDQTLADVLKEEGLQVSRRTVNKYRDELGIPPKSFRRCVS